MMHQLDYLCGYFSPVFYTHCWWCTIQSYALTKWRDIQRPYSVRVRTLSLVILGCIFRYLSWPDARISRAWLGLVEFPNRISGWRLGEGGPIFRTNIHISMRSAARSLYLSLKWNLENAVYVIVERLLTLNINPGNKAVTSVISSR